MTHICKPIDKENYPGRSKYVIIIDIILSIFGNYVIERCSKAISMIRLSRYSEHRSRYQILHDYTAERDVLSACTTASKVIDKYNNNMIKYIDSQSRVKQDFLRNPDDVEEMFASLIDCGNSELACYYGEMHDSTVRVFRQLKCADPNALYVLLDAYWLSLRYDSMYYYFKSMLPSSKSCSDADNISYHSQNGLRAALQLLINRCNFRNKNGGELHFAFDSKQLKEYIKKSTTTAWQKKYAASKPMLIDVIGTFSDKKIQRSTWKLESYITSFSFVDRTMLLSSGVDIKCRELFKFKRLLPCYDLFEQASLHNVMTSNNATKIKQGLIDYVSAHSRLKHIDPRRSPRSLVVFESDCGNTKKKKYNKDNDTEMLYYIGVFNSISEASRELDIPYKDIHRYMNTDSTLSERGREFRFIPLESYIRFAHDIIEQSSPGSASDLLPFIVNNTTSS